MRQDAMVKCDSGVDYDGADCSLRSTRCFYHEMQGVHALRYSTGNCCSIASARASVFKEV